MVAVHSALDERGLFPFVLSLSKSVSRMRTSLDRFTTNGPAPLNIPERLQRSRCHHVTPFLHEMPCLLD